MVDDTSRICDPLIILAAPRSGSTLLFETLAKAPDLWTIGGESHRLIEGIAALNPQFGVVESNRLTASNARPKVVRALRRNFADALRDREGNRAALDVQGLRLLEKTPKNALRQPFLDVLFPDARYIWLTREPRANIASMIEAWNDGRWTTYQQLPGWEGKWSLLLPPGWREMADQSTARKCAWQWASANSTIANDLALLPEDRWLKMRYEDLNANSGEACREIAEFASLSMDQQWQDYLNRPLPASRYTKSAPAEEKWRIHEEAIMAEEATWGPVAERINA